MNIAIKSFRIISYLEGLSFLVLLGIAMPLKYLFDLPMWVTVSGALHGFLFIAYVLAVLIMMFVLKWSIKQGFLALVASVIPFGPFLVDSRLLKNHEATKEKVAS